MRVYNAIASEPDIEIDPKSYLHILKELQNSDEQLQDGSVPHRGPKVLFCITMYQEEWYQILQSVIGCIRSILELEQEDPQKYSSNKFGIVLICGKCNI